MSNSKMFQGYYKDFKDIKTSTNIFKNKTWLDREYKKIKYLKKLQPHQLNISRDYPLLVATSMIFDDKKLLKIIDFGGAFGKSYLSISKGIVGLKKLKYYIVDLPNICSIAKNNFIDEKKIRFCKKIPNIKDCDIFHFGSSLQYIEDWKAVLIQMKNIKPKYLIFSDLIAGDIKEFVTKQSFNKSVMPYRFYNIKKFVNFISKLGYKLVLRNNYQVQFNNKLSFLPTKKFPIDSRLEYSTNLIFKKNETKY